MVQFRRGLSVESPASVSLPTAGGLKAVPLRHPVDRRAPPPVLRPECPHILLTIRQLVAHVKAREAELGAHAVRVAALSCGCALCGSTEVEEAQSTPFCLRPLCRRATSATSQVVTAALPMLRCSVGW